MHTITKSAIWIILSCFTSGGLSAQFYTVSGRITNSAMEPVGFVNVSVIENASLNSTSDVKGNYTLKITEGSYVLVFTMEGFKTLKLPVTVNHADVVQNVILEAEETQFQGVKVTGKKIDRSVEIVKLAIQNKYKYMYSDPYTIDAYIKATESEQHQKKKKDTSKMPGASNLNMAEVYLTLHHAPPDKIKEQRTGVTIRGSKEGLFFLTHTDGEFNFYRNLIEVPALSESPFLSPISNSGIIAYKYKMMKVFYENGIKYYRIKVQPGMMGNALVTGEIVIRDSLWSIQSLKLSFPKYHMAEYDFFEVSQDYEMNDSQYVLKKQEFIYNAKFGKSKSSGRTVVYYSNYVPKQVFKKRFFNTELSSTEQMAYERDSSFWNTIRKEPFTKDELNFIRRSDSMKALQSQKYWQDSVDKEFNRITFKKLFLTGQSHYNRSKETEWSFKPLVFAYLPFYIAGPRLDYWVYYEQTNKNKKSFNIFQRINYGIYNNDIKGTLTVSKLYNPFTRGFVTATVGSDFGIINPYEAWITVFARKNFYVQDFASIFHRRELVNGLYFGTGVEYSNRHSISNYTFDSRADSTNLYPEGNDPVNFESYMALYASFYLSYTPFQRYIREPYQKLILGSRWPDFIVRYRKGLNVLGSTVNFDYMEYGIEQEFKLGLAGISKYRIVSGEFLNTNDLRLVDYKFQRRAGPIFFSNPLYSFQGIDKTYNTIKRFYEGHYFHRFNGALLNKIPIMKKLNLIECAGGGLLYTHERNMRYAEAFIGIEKIIRFWKERIKIGVFYVVSESNVSAIQPQVKFTIEVYDKVKNRWGY
jgi:hypothetical protein